jgi:hypothetical protein
MYGLNYQGAAQVWDMMKTAKRDPETGEYLDAEKLAEEIKKLQKDPDFQSDSEKLQTALNTLNDNLVNVGHIEFNNTELPLIYTAVNEIKNKLIDKSGGYRNLGSDDYHPAIPEIAGKPLEETGGYYGGKITEALSQISTLYREGSFSPDRETNSQIYRRLSWVFNDAAVKYTLPESAGGFTITKDEWDSAYNDFAEALKEINKVADRPVVVNLNVMEER